ncbi:MAG: hypothetical protein KA831_03725 [Pyrinomonadaceae bacterium]|nr:hypothetical protein [Pyrinomonadaceae bacterium]
MKKLFLALIICFPVLTLQAQSISEIKNIFALQQFDKAKIDIDRAFANGDSTKRAEAHLLKATIYASLAMSDANKGNPIGDQLNNEAVVAFYKYREMEPSIELVMTDPVYRNAPINIYASFYASGYNDYANKRWQAGFGKLKKAVELSDLLTAKRLRTGLDTNVLILAGVTAENSGNRKDAAVFYGRLGDNSVSGEGFESVYRFLVTYWFEMKNLALYEKYKALGRRIYPNSEFFKFDKVDFAVGLAEGLTEKINALENVLATDPDNFQANEMLGGILYETLNSEAAPLPGNADEWESKMVRAYNKIAAAKPGSEMPYLFLGEHFTNKAAKIRDAFANELKAMAEAGVTPSIEKVSNRSKMEQEYAAAMEAALIPCEKAAALLAKKPNDVNQDQQLRDKENYKKVVANLLDIFTYKQAKANKNSPEFGTWAEKLKKWNDVYEGIK